MALLDKHTDDTPPGFVEEWDDHAALLQHFAVPASRAFARQIAEMAVEPPRMAVHQATPVPR